MSLAELKDYEEQFDKLISELPIWQLPVRPLLTALHLTVDSLFNGSRLDGSRMPRPLAGSALGARLSYLVPHLLKCDAEPIGRDGDDALRAVNEADPQGVCRFALVTYGHFCELMPEVHKGYYAVAGDKTQGFTLTHANGQFAHHEATDIILTELSLSFLSSPPPPMSDRFDRQAKTAPRFDLGLKFATIKLYYEHYCKHLIEPPILTDEGYLAAIGVGRDEFERFRAAMFAYADYCRGMAAATVRRFRQKRRFQGLSGRKNNMELESVWKELVEWVSVNWKETFFLGSLQGLTGLAPYAIDRLISLFSVDFRAGKKWGQHAGDGFLPPLARLEQSFVFNPDLLQRFLPARNILYALNKTERKLYDNLVSKHLEPELLAEAESLFHSFPGLAVVKNVIWQGGEIDLLVFSESENSALHVQAKAAIPPQGARMVKAVEGRMAEGLDQLRVFRELPQSDRDCVLSAALGREVKGVRVIDAVLSRSCLGTENVWSKLADVVALNLTLLRLTLKKARPLGTPLSISGFPTLVSAELGRIMGAAAPRFVEREAPLGTTMFRLPLLEFDPSVVAEEQRRAWL